MNTVKVQNVNSNGTKEADKANISFGVLSVSVQSDRTTEDQNASTPPQFGGFDDKSSETLHFGSFEYSTTSHYGDPVDNNVTTKSEKEASSGGVDTSQSSKKSFSDVSLLKAFMYFWN